MGFGGFGKGGYPATYSSGYSKAVPSVSSFSKGFPGYGGFGKGFAKPFGKGIGKGFGKGFSKGYPATLSKGYNTAVPSTTVVTGPSVGGFGKI